MLVDITKGELFERGAQMRKVGDGLVKYSLAFLEHEIDLLDYIASGLRELYSGDVLYYFWDYLIDINNDITNWNIPTLHQAKACILPVFCLY